MEAGKKNNQHYEIAHVNKYFALYGLNGSYNVMAISVIESDQNVKIEQQLFKQALVIMQKRHPFWRACLEFDKAANKMHLELMDHDEALSKIHCEFVDLTNEPFNREKLLDISANFNLTLFAPNDRSLLWKAQFISYTENSMIKYMVNINFFISITDGFNSVTLNIELINILNALLTGKECDEMKVVLDVVDDLYELSQQRGLFGEEQKKAMARMNEEAKDSKVVNFQFPDKFRSPNDSGYRLNLFKLDRETTAKILSRSRLNKSKLTAYFYAAIFYAVKKMYDEEKIEFPEGLIFEFAASLRCRYKPMLEFAHCGTHVTLSSFTTDRSQFGEFKDFWKDCLTLDNLISEWSGVENGKLFSFTHSFETIEELSDMLVNSPEKLNEHLNPDIGLSNIGAYVDKNVPVFPGPFKIDELYCSDSLKGKLPFSIVIHILYFKGESMIQIGSNKYLMSTEYINKFQKLFKETIAESLE